MKVLSMLCMLAGASAFRVPSMPPSGAVQRRAPVTLMADAPVMADGAGMYALIGGILCIATAGIPILWLSNEKDTKAERAAGLEAGLRSELGDAAFEDSLMEVVDEVPEASSGDDTGKTASL